MMFHRTVAAATATLKCSPWIIGNALIFAGFASTAFAQSTAPAPEIDGASASSALALLFGGMLLLRSRFRGK
jgi:hypothetical protein